MRASARRAGEPGLLCRHRSQVPHLRAGTPFRRAGRDGAGNRGAYRGSRLRAHADRRAAPGQAAEDQGGLAPPGLSSGAAGRVGGATAWRRCRDPRRRSAAGRASCSPSASRRRSACRGSAR